MLAARGDDDSAVVLDLLCPVDVMDEQVRDHDIDQGSGVVGEDVNGAARRSVSPGANRAFVCHLEKRAPPHAERC